MNDLNNIQQNYQPLNVSVFDNIQVFDQTMRMATALSKSAFVPKAFQGSPESCLVAIDLARRLEVSPMTIFPHLYVIDAKPAFSTQFLITLVNRSGMFNRLDWETGVDGKTKVHYCDWKNNQREQWEEDVPNHYAVAKLTERRTGKTFTSPKVDIAFAELNGWTSKPGSKWRVMPEIMCAYRSASILIKRICPELTLGMNFAEDVEDAAETTIELHQDAYVEPLKPLSIEQSAPSVSEYTHRIDDAQTLDELKAVGASIASAGFDQETRRLLGIEYKRRQSELSSTEENDEKLMLEDELATAIRESESEEALRDVEEALEIATANGNLAGSAYGRLSDMLKSKLSTIAGDKQQTDKITRSQKANYNGLTEALEKCKDKEAILNLLKTAEGYVKNKMMTAKQLTQFQHEADRKADTFLV